MESLFAVLPFFNAGLAGAVFARFTGVNMSAAVLLILLYMGAKPVEAVSAMLMFNAFTYFTIYTQRHVMGIKDFVIFPGFKIMIPVLITIAAAVFSPFFGIVFFVAVFLAEIFAKMYQSMDVKDKPATASLAKMCGIAAVLALGGVALVRFMPEDGYYIFVGLVILGTAVLAWQGGDRRKWERVWDRLLYGGAFLVGLVGIELTDWFGALQRSRRTELFNVYPIVINTAVIVALVGAYFLYGYFSLGALFSTIGSAVGIRLFGLYEHGTKGSFSYLAIGLTVLAVLVFWLIQPSPTGLPELPLIDSEQRFFGW